eukprot:TRINITY_DN45863_c0_g1_i1.p1 TRINITY_DN45863_c0_g1~~TRINITY_DN45863_c0_g1_i1.p1  ORF type:complete len:141 (+),score=12.65 TRINITY_DN45863_c0_g1_i1:58-480(+)
MDAPGHTVHGMLEDYTHSRCFHWHSELDVLALLAPCCSKFYSCADCHNAIEAHQLEPWPASTSPGTTALLCGVCGHGFSLTQYLSPGFDSRCPSCEASFNPRCRKHWPLYFHPELIQTCDIQPSISSSMASPSGESLPGS